MPTLLQQTSLPGFIAEDLWRWHMNPGAFHRLVPPWHRLEVTQSPQVIEDDALARFRVRVGPLRFRWEAHHHDVLPPHGFTDTARRGPFDAWRHHHRFRSDGDQAILEDEVYWRAPGGLLGRALEPWLRRDLQAMFAYRHRITAADLQEHQRFADRPRLTVAISGASGLVGSALSAFLTTGGHTVRPLTRRTGPSEGIPWSVREGGLRPEDLQGVDAVVHLAGSPIAKRWTADAKEEIRHSRVQGTRTIAEALAACTNGPKVLISASACGYYGAFPGGPVDESSPAGDGFLGSTGQAWERAADPAREAGIRVVHPRIGLVISGKGGALPAMLPAFRAGLGGPLGSGAQGFPWVALDDLVSMIHHALMEPSWTGPFNAVAPQPCSQRDFAKSLGRALRRPAVVPVPAAVLRVAGGQAAHELLLGGQHVHALALHRHGFVWRHPDLTPFLRLQTGRMEERT